MKRAWAFFFLLCFAGAAVLESASMVPRVVFQGKIVRINSSQGWVSVYSPYGLLFLEPYPGALIFKNGAKASLSAFKPGENVVAVPAETSRRGAVLILALEDWQTYHARTGVFPKPFAPAPPRTKIHQPPFVQMDGKIAGLNPERETILIESRGGKEEDVKVVSETKIYAYSGNRFSLLGFDKLWVGEWVRAGGFSEGEMLRAESVLVLPGAPK